MEYLTSQAHYPGALSDDAAALLKTIIAAGAYQPDYATMNRAQLDGLGQLIHIGYIQSCSWWQYRARGVDPLVSIKAQQDTRNRELNRLYSGQDQLVAKWEAKAAIKDFRMRPWLPTSRVNYIHVQLERDIELALAEWQAAS